MTTINRKEFLEALAPLKPAIPVRNSIEALTHIWFDGDYAYAHDGGLGVRVKFASDLELGVPGNLFLNMLAQTSGDSLEVSQAEGALTFKAGRSNVKMVTLPLDRRVWPYPDKPTGKATASLKASDGLLKGLERVFMVRPSNPKRMEHYAVCIFPFDKEMDLCVTDSRTLAVAPVTEAVTGKVNAIALPRSFAERVVAHCEDSPVIQMFEDHFRVEANDTITLYSNVFDTSDILDLPAFADKFCDEKKAPPFALPEGLRPALERAELLAGTEEPAITLQSNGKKLKLKGKFKFGELDEEFELTKILPKCTVVANIKLILAAKGADKMMLMKEGITLRGDEGFIYTLAAITSSTEETAETD